MRIVKPALILSILCISLTASGQHGNNSTSKNKKSQIVINNTQSNKMNLSIITNGKVRSALEAWQNGDGKTFLSYFTENPKMTDDGNSRDFAGFVKSACGQEKYLTIDKVENDGKDVYGNFKAGQWGTFKVFFKFHLNTAGKFDRLDIGQTTY